MSIFLPKCSSFSAFLAMIFVIFVLFLIKNTFSAGTWEKDGLFSGFWPESITLLTYPGECENSTITCWIRGIIYKSPIDRGISTIYQAKIFLLLLRLKLSKFNLRLGLRHMIFTHIA